MSQVKIKVKKVDIMGRPGSAGILDSNNKWWYWGNDAVKRKMNMLLKDNDLILTVDLNNLIVGMETVNSEEIIKKAKETEDRAERLIIEYGEAISLKVINSKQVKLKDLNILSDKLLELSYEPVVESSGDIVYKKLK